MMYRNLFRTLPCFVLIVAFTGRLVLAQSRPASLLTGQIDERTRVTLKGNVHPLAQARYDRGTAPDSLPLERMLLMLKRSAERESLLERFIEEAHTPGSSNYHKWLTPEQFGELYGPDDSSIRATTAWLEKHGFSVARVTKGKTAVEFSGTPGQLREAFLTEIHSYIVNGEAHLANDRDPQIPAALASVISGITPLNDFRPTPQVRVLGKALYDPKTRVVKPEWTINGTPPVLALAPGDFAVQYDLNPLYNAGTNGAGVTIGIIGASNVFPNVVADYRSFFGLPPGTLNIIIDGIDPGPSATVDRGNWAELESFLDVEVSGSVAPGATINLYTAADTSVQSGLLLAAERAVDDNVAAVLSTSYGECEQDLGTSGNQFWAALWEQAAAQGQTSFVSSGDNGPAGCDNPNAVQTAERGLAVNGLSSTPSNISVGGTDFFYSSYNGTTAAQTTELATYWNMTPSGISSPATSLLKPVPEQPWNQAFGLDLYDSGVYNPNQPTIVAGSGGASSSYQKPAWQSGKGVLSDGMRDLPDVSLFAAAGENDSFYPICLPSEGCTGLNPAYMEVTAVGGTSASSPAMAAIMALVNQKYGRQGQANFVLYPLRTQHPAVFHDISIGSNKVPCVPGSPSCVQGTANDNTKSFFTFGYYAGAGYDPATGLGSVDANLLVQYWNSLSFASSNTSLNVSQTAFTHGTPVNVNVAVAGSGGVPSGDVGLLANQSPDAANVSLNALTLSKGAASATVNNLPGGQYQLTARYTGDTIFAPSSSSPVTLNVAPEASSVTVLGGYWSNGSNSFLSITNGASFTYGTYLAIDAQPIGVNAPQGGSDGVATGTVTFTDTVGSSNLSSGLLNLNVKGIAEWQATLSQAVGQHSVSASYSGDASFHASTSSTPLTFTITKAPTAAFLIGRPSPVALGSVLTLEMDLSNPFSGPPCLLASCTFFFPSPASPTGTVTFSFGNTPLGTASIIPNYNNFFASTATFIVSSLPLGTDTVSATYTGDRNYNSVTSTFNVVVEQPATLSATANPSSINQAEFTQVIATVVGPSGLAVPTGTVSFFAHGIGSDWNDTEQLKNGSAISIALPGGYFFPPTNGQISVPIDVSYSGDSTYGPASGNVSLTVNQGFLPPFTVSATPVTITVPGTTVGNTSTVTVTPSNGFTGPVYVSCTLTSSPTGAVNLPTCSVPSPPLNITGSSPVTATMTVNSTARSSSAFFHSPRSRLWLMAQIIAGMLLLLPLSVSNRRFRWRLTAASFLLLFSITTGLVGCGGGSAKTPPPPPPGNPGTTPGSYTFIVNASFTVNGVSQAQNTVTVTIQ